MEKVMIEFDIFD